MPSEYESEVTADREAAAAVLSDMADGVLAGSVALGGRDDPITVALPETVELEVEFETDDRERSLEVEMEWAASEEAGAIEEDEEAAAGAGKEGGGREVDAADGRDSGDDGGNSGGSDGREDGNGDDEEWDEAEDETTPVSVGAATPLESLARFELFRDRADEWRWRLRHRNGNIIATSGEGYTQKHNARKGLRSVVDNAPGATVRDESAE